MKSHSEHILSVSRNPFFIALAAISISLLSTGASRGQTSRDLNGVEIAAPILRRADSVDSKYRWDGRDDSPDSGSGGRGYAYIPTDLPNLSAPAGLPDLTEFRFNFSAAYFSNSSLPASSFGYSSASAVYTSYSPLYAPSTSQPRSLPTPTASAPPSSLLPASIPSARRLEGSAAGIRHASPPPTFAAAPTYTAGGSGASTDFNVNAYLGANAFYNAGITGTTAIVANIEGGFIWNGHEGLTQVTTQFYDGGALSANYEGHATAVGHTIGYNSTNGNPQLNGIAYGIGANLWSGNVATSNNADGSFGISYNSQMFTFRDALLTGVTVNGQVKKADLTNSSYGPVSSATSTPGDFDSTGSNGGDNSRYHDALIAATGKTVIFSAGNSANVVPYLTDNVGGAATGYNTVSVGALGLYTDPVPFDRLTDFSSRGPSDTFIPAVVQPTFSSTTNNTPSPGSGTFIAANTVNPRIRIDLVAPGQGLYLANYNSAAPNSGEYLSWSGTSFSAPTVAGGFALLVDYARGAGLVSATNTQAIDVRVLKSVMLNSADKPTAWTNQQVWNGTNYFTRAALDSNYGAGRMNLAAAYAQFAAPGVSQNATGMGGGSVADTGWAYGNVTVGIPNNYSMTAALTAGTEINATLDWLVNRYINNTTQNVLLDGVAIVPNATAEVAFHHLDLEVYRSTSSGLKLVAQSSSLYNATQHLSFLAPVDGTYTIQVSRPTGGIGNFDGAGALWDFGTPGGSSAPVNNTDYGVAWMTRNSFVQSGTQSFATGTASSSANGLVGLGGVTNSSITGSGTALTINNSFSVGGTDLAPATGTASLTISGGASLVVNNTLRVHAGSSIAVGGGTLAVGQLTVDAGASVTVAAGSTYGFNNLDLGGTLAVAGPTASTTSNAAGSAVFRDGSILLNSQGTLQFQGGNGATTTLIGNVTLGGSSPIVFQSSSALAGSGNLVKAGFEATNSANSRLTLYGASTYTGSTTVLNGAARQFLITQTQPFLYPSNDIYLRSAGTFGGSASSGLTVGNGAGIWLDNGSQFVANRIPAGVPVTFNGGAITFYGNAATASNDSISSLAISGLAAFYSGVNNGTLGTTNQVTFNGFSRADNATMVFEIYNGYSTSTPVGARLGGTPGSTTMNWIFGSGLTPLTDGSGTGQQAGVIPYATTRKNYTNQAQPFGAIGYNANGVTFMSGDDATYFVQASSSANFTANPLCNFNVTSGFNFTGSPTVTVNSLVVTNNSGLTTLGGAAALTISSGLVETRWTTTFNGPTLNFGSNTGYFHTGVAFNLQGTSTISGTAGIVVSGTNPAATFTFGPANPGLSGGLTVNGEIAAVISSDGQLGAAGSGITLGGGTLLDATAGTITLDPSRAVRLGAASGSFSVASGSTLAVPGVVSGPGDLLKVGAGTLVLSNSTNNFTGAIYVAGGTLLAGAANVLPAAANLVVGDPAIPANGGTFDLNGFAQSVASIAVGSNNTAANAITNSSATNAQLGVTSGTFSGTISGNLTLAKTGAGTLNLSGSNTYSGGTAVSAGKLIAGNTSGSATGTGSVSITGTGILAGNGFIVPAAGNAVSIGGGGTISPGGSIGTLTVNGSVQFNAGGIYSWNVNSTPGGSGATAGLNWSQLAISAGTLTGTATAANPFTIAVNAQGPVNGFDSTASYTWVIASFPAVGILTSDSFGITTSGWTGINSLGGYFSPLLTAGALEVVYTPVPEPGFLLAAGTLAALAARRRRSRIDPLAA